MYEIIFNVSFEEHMLPMASKLTQYNGHFSDISFDRKYTTYWEGKEEVGVVCYLKNVESGGIKADVDYIMAFAKKLECDYVPIIIGYYEEHDPNTFYYFDSRMLTDKKKQIPFIKELFMMKEGERMFELGAAVEKDSNA